MLEFAPTLLALVEDLLFVFLLANPALQSGSLKSY
jgi:hypothetical protein